MIAGSNPSPIVLLSGGLDSAVLAALLLESAQAPRAIFVDYGQRSAARERAAAVALSAYYGMSISEVGCSGLRIPVEGEINGRNAFLVLVAVMAEQPSSGAIAIGIHGGSEYPDCSPEFVNHLQTVLDLQNGGALQLLAPFVHMTKQEVSDLGQNLKIPRHLTYSCDRGSEPCSECPSCRAVLAIK